MTIETMKLAQPYCDDCGGTDPECPLAEKPWVKTYAGGEPQYTTPEKQPEQEPVAWMNPSWIDPDTRGWASDSFESIQIEGWIPLYTAPRRWQGLTGEEVAELTLKHAGYPVRLTEAIEAKLREKNT